jgi:hypothetical protein
MVYRTQFPIALSLLLTDKLDLPHPVRQQQRLRPQQVHLGHHLCKYGFAAATADLVVGLDLARGRGRLSHRYTIEFDNRPVLPVSNHGRLHHLPEGGLLGRGDEQGAQFVNAHAVGMAVVFSHAL